ncbi:VOC family protein [Paractinoplanes durhamensis]|uniref:Glyoxalase-like domain-containing protein n=1 Tax=Paractinoplanes durhamensis TaxID=113563 RepID=A0ABQ3YVX9_9ACTN|nr:VOC family protein [Actinoplanes durhamensis]GIE01760.1 hypothetical protein Adu01nite_31100 [Actinoplanes durhamensis]
MSSRLFALSFDASRPAELARFWSGILGWEIVGGDALQPADDTGFHLVFRPSSSPKTLPNWIHFDLTSRSLGQQQETVARALELGGRHHDVGQLPEELHVVLADPEGNEFCVVEPGNSFLAGCGFIGALSSDGSREVGYFWSEALGWPLVWDQDEETAIRSPHGGPKISWGGPPYNPKPARARLRYELLPDGDPQTELDRLLKLGATLLDAPAGRLADPDGNEFHLLPQPTRPF